MSTKTWAIMNAVSFFWRTLRLETDPMNHEIGRCKSIFCLILSLHSLISKSQNKTINIGSLVFILESTKSVVGLKNDPFHVIYEKTQRFLFLTLVSTVFQYSAASVSFLRKGFGMANLFWFSKISNSRLRTACLGCLCERYDVFSDSSWSLVEYRPRNWMTRNIYSIKIGCTVCTALFSKFPNGTWTEKWSFSGTLKTMEMTEAS